ncbi:MAG: peptidylprolyl isomerase [Fidelibacterota bacterium]
MGVMQKLREKTHIILWGVLILFVLSMTIGGLVGGANVLDIFSNDRKNMNITGKINDTEIEIRQFSDALQNQLQTIREQGREIDSQTRDMVSDRVWNSFVNEILIDEKADEYGFTATDEEVYESLVNNPPQMFQQHPSFQTDGQFDIQKYHQALQDPQINWLPFENQVRAQLPLTKMVTYVQSLPTVSQWEIRNEYIRNNVKFSLETLSMAITTVSREEVEVSDQEIEKRYKENKEDFLQKETREVKYVTFDIKPSQKDSMSAKNFAEDLIDRIESGESFKTVATEYTEDPSGQENGGDLGWFGEGRMAKPFSDAAFNADEGEIVGPVLTNFGYHIIKVEDFREKEGKKEVKARHILLKIETGPETQNEINSTANLFAYDANEFGFEAAADSYDVEIQTFDKLAKDTRYLPGLGFLPAASRFAFSDVPVGEISKLYSTEDSFVIFKLAGIKEEYYKELEDVKSSIKDEIVQEKRKEKLSSFANDVYAEIQSGKTLETIKEAEPKYNYAKIDTAVLTKPLKNLGTNDKLTGAVMALETNEVSKPIFINEKYVIVKLLDKTAINEEKFAAAREDLRKQLLDRKKSTYYNNWVQALRDNAKIVDNRANIF